ncbi:carbohydrate ABC transporter permease [Streptomyces arenae]|uniref:carbohydrate ABC transporter permease n=1 Tax=Streptomyces arenae TaxID=29301 RepID=UPI00265B32B9|nr:sugar ABC transporter permease [Streptomyces arenae]MCG7203558.1 sugar ABC transporter permease [Streptomyces arenae]
MTATDTLRPAGEADITPARRRSAAWRGESRPSPLAARRRKLFWPMLLPAVLVYVVFFAGPSLFTLWLSLNQWAGAGPMHFIGLDNYRRIFQDPTFRHSFTNTLWIILGAGGLTFLVSFGLTMVLREMKGRKAARSILFFPNIVPSVVLAILWGFLFQHDGLVDALAEAAGLPSPNWLGQENLFKVIMIGLVWTSTGFYTTILMAAVDQIPPELYEDCDLAGANALQKFRHVTLPLMWDVVGVCAVLWTISAVKVFEFIYAFAGAAGQMPDTGVWNTALYTYGEAFASGGVPRYGSAAASAVVMLTLVGVLVVLIRRFMRRDTVQY